MGSEISESSIKSLECFPESANDLPVEIYLEIFKFLPQESLINIIISCKRLYKVFDFYKKKTSVMPNIDLIEVRLQYVNNALNHHLVIENHLSVFNNLVELRNEDFKPYFTRNFSSERKKKLSSNYKEFEERFYERIGSQMTRKVVEEIFKFTSDKKYKFIIAGSSILNCMISDTKEFNDLDFFLILGENSEEQTDENIGSHRFNDRREYNEVKEFLITQLKHVIPSNTYYLFLNRSYLTICLEQDEREKKEGIYPPSIQINFRSGHTIEELLSMFDLDCCRFGYDGNHVYTTHQGVRFLNTGYNYIPERQKKICFRNRLEKYWKRGIDTIYTDSNRYYHPLLHYFSDRELQVLTHPVSYSKNRHLPVNHPKYYGITYRKELSNLYFYPLVNFPMTFKSLRLRHALSMDFHERHNCIGTYDKHSYFILDKFEDLNGHKSFGQHMKPRKYLMEFQYYFYFFQRPLYMNGEMRYRFVCEELIMLNFKFCRECLIFFDKSRSHTCSREKEITMEKMFMDDSDDDD